MSHWFSRQQRRPRPDSSLRSFQSLLQYLKLGLAESTDGSIKKIKHTQQEQRSVGSKISFIRILDIPYCEVVKSQNIHRVEGKCYRMIIISTDNTYQRTVVSKRYDDEEEHDDDDDMFTVYRLPENSTPTASFAISDCSACEKAESGKNSRPEMATQMARGLALVKSRPG